ncbi:MAG TPA: hypothetical protein VHL85_06350 [Burkholderiales bacterium]|jgi:hypothetical protein|nr:hypothetical protein [Burkholderiales bacterium]
MFRDLHTCFKRTHLFAMLLLLVCSPAAFGQASPMAWPTVQRQLQQHWKATYPAEKVLKVEPKGALQYYSTERRTEVDASWGWIWDSRVVETQGAFARQVALVTAERPDKTQARFEVAALFQNNGKQWQFRQVVVGKSENLSAAKAGDLPSSADAARIFGAAWKKTRPDFDVHAVEVLGAEPKQSQDRRWITYKLAVVATGTDKGSKSMYGKRYRCTPADYSSVLKLEGGAWVADEKMIANINEAGDCKEAK